MFRMGLEPTIPAFERAKAVHADTHWVGGWVGLRAGLEDVKKRKFLALPDSNSDPSVVQPVSSHYTDYAILAPRFGR
jgi:hypothetical protein